MNRKLYLFILSFFLTISSSLIAQTQLPTTQFYLTGLGRTIVTNNKLNGNVIKNDALTPNKGVSGYMLFDLGANLRASENLRCNAILRVKNPFGTFFGEGVTFQFRQIQLMGRIAKTVDYQIGDINVEMTPYTVHAAPEMYHQYESEIFKMRRNIVNYENFVIGNAWRLQGVQGFATFPFPRNVESIKVHAFAVRTNATNDVTVPDRILAGGRVTLKQSNAFYVGVNYVGLQDIPISNSDIDYTNHVVTGDGKISSDKENVILSLSMEGGFSTYNNFRTSDKTTVSYNDYFFDIGTSEVFKPFKMKVFANYKDVGPQFSSPSAQTTRINVLATPELFSKFQNNSVNRPQMLFDRFTQEGIYNRAISPVLLPFLPQYGNISPYGAATPNRRGFSAGLASDTSIKVFTAEFKADLLTEIIGEGVTDLRKFTGLKGGILFNVGKLLNLKRMLSVNLGERYEKTTRGGFVPVNLSSTLIDAGISMEVINKIDLLVGVKSLSAKGNEYMGVRDQFNQFSSFTALNLNIKEKIYSFGARVRFSTNAYFTVNYNRASSQNNMNTTLNYNINQLFINYTVIF
ncbi:MAG TPA: hypothetical protein VNW99_08050 [Cytophagaceae bacterium]|jgi:hypothetical protein|nr:hypothetical protein [Cytophagaceae bacterium]